MNEVLTRNLVNDLDLTALGEVVTAIQADPAQALTRFTVSTR